MPPQPDTEDRGLCVLPAQCNTVAAEDLRTRLVLAADWSDHTRIDASGVESIGQAVLQLLTAAYADSAANGRDFSIVNPSPSFLARVDGCKLSAAVGLASERTFDQ
ncbi:MAG: STAS domain-containing protein [Sandaracinobacter sp.]|jgi:anti-anti-sigma regulatory factor